MKAWLENFRKEYATKEGGGKLVVFLGLVGMAFILCSELCAIPTQEVTIATQDGAAADETQMNTTLSSEEAYRASLEESLATLISQLEGAGETAVMITLVSGSQTIYAQDITVTETQSVQDHVLLEDGSALSEMVLTPIVCGVVVLCQGGDNILLEAKITEMVTALFDISSNHVSVEKLG